MADEERRDTARNRDHSPAHANNGREHEREPGRREDEPDDWRHERHRSPLTEREQRERWPVD